MKYKFIFTLILITNISVLSTAQSTLMFADSLYAKQKFTEAYEQYLILYQQNQASPSMLLKMAFIQDGLENYEKVLYYLSQYYNLTANKKVLIKMSELAKKYELEGYIFSDAIVFQNLFLQYQFIIKLLLLVLAIGMFWLIYHRKSKNRNNYFPIVFQIITLTILFIINQNFFIPTQGIIWKEQTLIMSGPSAGAEPLALINKGHRINVLEEGDVWSKIRWQEREAFIRKNSIKIL